MQILCIFFFFCKLGAGEKNHVGEETIKQRCDRPKLLSLIRPWHMEYHSEVGKNDL